MGGWPILHDFSLNHFTEGALSLRFLQGWVAMLLALLDLAVAERSIALDARIPDSRPCTERKSGAPTSLLMPARSKARATRPIISVPTARPRTTAPRAAASSAA